MDISTTMLIPSQYAEKFPATKPDRMLREGPPSREEVTTSATCVDSVEVKTLTSSGMIAPAKVPHEMMVANSHHNSVLPFSEGTISFETTKVRITETMEVIHTSDVSGASKFIVSLFA